jgi:hypothetical protein
MTGRRRWRIGRAAVTSSRHTEPRPGPGPGRTGPGSRSSPHATGSRWCCRRTAGGRAWEGCRRGARRRWAHRHAAVWWRDQDNDSIVPVVADSTRRRPSDLDLDLGKPWLWPWERAWPWHWHWYWYWHWHWEWRGSIAAAAQTQLGNGSSPRRRRTPKGSTEKEQQSFLPHTL